MPFGNLVDTGNSPRVELLEEKKEEEPKKEVPKKVPKEEPKEFTTSVIPTPDVSILWKLGVV